MSEYNKPQDYDVYEYNTATRPEQAQDYAGFASHPPYAPEYVGSQAQVPSGLPQSTGLSLIPSTQQQYGTHDPTYYTQQQTQYPAYLESEARQLPTVVSYSPASGQQGTKVTVYFNTNYDLENPQASVVMMFGHKRCDSTLVKTSHTGSPYQYCLSADAPSLSATSSPSPLLQLRLSFEGSTTWQSPTLDFGEFTYFDHFPVDSPTQSRKRKITPETSERLSPIKKPTYMQQRMSRTESQSYYQSAPPSTAGSTDYSRSGISDPYGQSRRFSVPEINYGQTLPRVQTQQYYGSHPTVATGRLQTGQSPYSYYANLPSVSRSPSTAGGMSAGARASQLLPSPAGGTNPPLIRTSTIQASPSTPGSTTQSFNPYAMYPANSKAMLKIEGDLNSMVDNWTPEEWESKRRLVQFRRSQAGSVISATFEPVTPEERAPNSICVSCIYWTEKQECYVTSVDTIQLLESLVAVRFTVEEKNRIRRNLEGFRPATVSKTKPESEEFFKLIMLFPAPKPRNIEKDVKVFPWRILATALKKIIGKYASHLTSITLHHHTLLTLRLQSASYSSTAGALQQPAAGPSYARGADVALDPSHQSQRSMISPMTTASSTSHAYATAMTSQAYAGGSAGLGVGPSAGPTDLRLSVTGAGTGQTASWHQPATHYGSSATDLDGSASAGRGSSWDFGSYLSTASPATGLPGSAQASQYQYGLAPAQTQQHQRIPSMGLSQASHTMNEGRFLPLYEHEEPSQQTSGA